VLEDGGSVEEVVAALPENERHLLVVAAIRFVNQFGPSLADCFLLGKAQPKNALVTPPPQIWKQMQTFKRVHTYRSINNFTFLQFSSFGQPQSK
jgi:hypothetical protein